MPSELGIKSSDANREEKLKLLVQDVYLLKAGGRRMQVLFFFFSSWHSQTQYFQVPYLYKAATDVLGLMC